MKNQKPKTPKKKSGIKKAFVIGALILIILIVAVLAFVLTRLDFIVKSAIEKYGSGAAGAAVSVESVKIRLREGSGAISGLTVANPKGFEGPHAFSLGEIGVGIDIRSLPKEVKVINDIHVLAPEIFVESNGARAVNLNVIKENLARPAPSQKSAPARKDKTGPEPRLIIRHILFSDGIIKARIASLNDKTVNLRLPSVEMRNLGGNNGATPDELTRQILGELCRRALQEVGKKVGGIAAEKAKDAIKSQVESGIGKLLR